MLGRLRIEPERRLTGGSAPASTARVAAGPVGVRNDDDRDECTELRGRVGRHPAKPPRCAHIPRARSCAVLRRLCACTFAQTFPLCVCIGAPGFEPGTSPTRTERATRLRHAPMPRDYLMPSPRPPCSTARRGL